MRMAELALRFRVNCSRAGEKTGGLVTQPVRRTVSPSSAFSFGVRVGRCAISTALPRTEHARQTAARRKRLAAGRIIETANSTRAKIADELVWTQPIGRMCASRMPSARAEAGSKRGSRCTERSSDKPLNLSNQRN